MPSDIHTRLGFAYLTYNTLDKTALFTGATLELRCYPAANPKCVQYVIMCCSASEVTINFFGDKSEEAYVAFELLRRKYAAPPIQ